MKLLSLCAGFALLAAASASWAVERSAGALVDADGWSELEGVGLHPASPEFSSESRGWPQSDAGSSLQRRGKSGSSKACFSTWHPSSSRTLVAATGSHVRPIAHVDQTLKNRQWSGRPPCGSFVELRRGSHKVVVRIIDLCDGCSRGKAWLDLSTSAFKRLGMSLGKGEASGIKWRVVKTPHSFSKTRYGPKKVHL